MQRKGYTCTVRCDDVGVDWTKATVNRQILNVSRFQFNIDELFYTRIPSKYPK